MRTSGLLLAVLMALAATARAQEIDAPEGAIIRSAEVAGVPVDIDQALRREIDALVGDPLHVERLRQLATRIEAEHPGVVVAIRGIAAPDNQVRIVFLAAKVRDDEEGDANVNARYTVEKVEIEGVPESAIDRTLRADLQSLVGRRLDREEVDRLAGRLTTALPGYELRRQISRGSERGRIRLVFVLEKPEAMRWIHFSGATSKLLFHSDQGWGGLLDLGIGGRDLRVSPLFALDNRDDLLEEYSGFGVRIEARNLATERVGLSVELATFDDTWQPETLAALAVSPAIPEAYRSRSTIAPAATFAFTPRVRVTGGVSISELESLTRTPLSQMANAFTLAVGYDQRWESSGSSHDVAAEFSWRSATTSLESDLTYTRYLWNGSYRFRRGRSLVLASAFSGLITGQAPLFERFSLGDSTTLRGWNKYDIAPAGGDRTFHSSLEYRNRGLAFFLDAGSVWDHGADSQGRGAAGFGYHIENFFLTVGFPLNTDELRAAFMTGVRF